MAPRRCHQGTWEEPFTRGLPHPSPGLRAALLPPRDRYLQTRRADLSAGRTLRPKCPGHRRATHRPGAAIPTKAGMAWDIVDITPISMEATWGWAPGATVSHWRTPCPTGMSRTMRAAHNRRHNRL